MAKVLFIPFSITGGLLAGFVGKKIFDGVWGLVDEEEPPDGSQRDVPWAKLIAAAAVQGAIFRAVKTATDRGSREAFMSVTGTWPGEEEPDPA
ncbi:MAG: DUF4235 domain-containing protein [Thermoleophilaceae bacterium]